MSLLRSLYKPLLKAARRFDRSPAMKSSMAYLGDTLGDLQPLFFEFFSHGRDSTLRQETRRPLFYLPTKDVWKLEAFIKQTFRRPPAPADGEARIAQRAFDALRILTKHESWARGHFG